MITRTIQIIMITLLYSCVVDEDIVENNLWHNISGNWKLDESFLINSKQFFFKLKFFSWNLNMSYYCAARINSCITTSFCSDEFNSQNLKSSQMEF